MKAVLKNGLTVEIDTTCLFENQYNLFPAEGEKNGKRIFDAEVVRIIDDARVGMGKCGYCGALVKRGEEEKHFAEMEAKIGQCDKCLWWRGKIISSSRSHSDPVRKELPDGKIEETRVDTTIYIMQKECEYERYGGCACAEHRKHGIRWFTPENTFFLKYPDGFNGIGTGNLIANGFIKPNIRELRNGTYVWEYRKKIGSYYLSAIVRYESGKQVEITNFYLRNCRRHYDFRFEDGKWFIHDGTFGWKQVPYLQGVPADVENRVKKIVKGVKGNA